VFALGMTALPPLCSPCAAVDADEIFRKEEAAQWTGDSKWRALGISTPEELRARALARQATQGRCTRGRSHRKANHSTSEGTISMTTIRTNPVTHLTRPRVRTPHAVHNAPPHAPGFPRFPNPPGLAKPSSRPHTPR
jgi:hypothetical protein